MKGLEKRNLIFKVDVPSSHPAHPGDKFAPLYKRLTLIFHLVKTTDEILWVVIMQCNAYSVKCCDSVATGLKANG